MGSTIKTPIRWRDDTGWEFRCGDCAKAGTSRFWPLTEEFWDRARGMLRCRACWRARDRQMAMGYFRSNPESWREQRRERQREARRAHREAERIISQIRWQRTKSDPVLLERARAKGREAQRRYRERRRAA